MKQLLCRFRQILQTVKRDCSHDESIILHSSKPNGNTQRSLWHVFYDVVKSINYWFVFLKTWILDILMIQLFVFKSMNYM